MNILNLIRDKHSLVYKALLYFFSVAIIAYFLPSNTKFTRSSVVGLKTWPYENLVAESDIFVKKNEALIRSENRSIRESSPLYFTINNEERDKNLAELKAGIAAGGQSSILKTAMQLLDSVYNKGVIETVEGDLHPKSIFIVSNGYAEQESYYNFFTVDSAIAYFHRAVASNPDQDIILDNCINYLAITVFFDRNTTNKNLNENLQSTSLYKANYKKGDVLIRQMEDITPEKREVIDTYLAQQAGAKSTTWRNVCGRLLLGATVLAILMLYLAFFRKNIFGQNGHVTFVFLIVILSTIVASKVSGYGTLFFWSIPFALVPVLIRIFFDSRTALFTFLISILLCSFFATDKFQFVFIQLITGMGTVFSVAEMQKRKALLASAIVVLLFYLAAFVAFNLIYENEKVLLQKLFYLPFLISSMLILLAYPFIFLAEKLFGFISDFTLMELCDLNAPLLRELSQKVPGTFQHSLQVANLAEEAIFHIGGNSLLVRAGAMYHDIGKMENPRYFTENQIGEINPHAEILPEESARIIISHVIKGVEKAKLYKLPEQVIDFIRTHHGTTTVGFFLNNFRKEHEGETVNEDAFRYQGPIPFSKETAVLMMADGVEAASRSLKKYDAMAINDLVDRMIDYKVKENQFINADITFKDITIVKKIFKKRLMNMYHVRIEYPR
ncbi:MAG: HD family phosphohydrolase [Bacteroidia bacterium]